MNLLRKHTFSISLVLLALVVLVSTALAQTEGGYHLDWWTINGGGIASGDGYSLHSVIGQPESGSASGGDYTLSGGLLARFVTIDWSIFLPLTFQ